MQEELQNCTNKRNTRNTIRSLDTVCDMYDGVPSSVVDDGSLWDIESHGRRSSGRTTGGRTRGPTIRQTSGGTARVMRDPPLSRHQGRRGSCKRRKNIRAEADNDYRDEPKGSLRSARAGKGSRSCPHKTDRFVWAKVVGE